MILVFVTLIAMVVGIYGLLAGPERWASRFGIVLVISAPTFLMSLCEWIYT